MEKLKVLYIITKSDVGGAQKYVADLAHGLDKNIFEAKILYGGKDIKWLSNKVAPWLLFLNDWLAVFELVRVFSRERPQVIHLNSSKAGVLGSLAAGIYKLPLKFSPLTSHPPAPKVVFTAHGWIFNPTNYLSGLARLFYIIMHKTAAVAQDWIINVSEYDRKLALQYKIAPDAKLVTIHNGIDPNILFLDKETARKEIVNKLELEIDRPWVGSIGRLTPEKNYETLVRTAINIPEAYFFIIGAGPEQNQLLKLIAYYNLQRRFFLIKPTGNDALYLKSFDVFVLSSIKEGLPYTLLEAMAAELPIAVTNAGGMPETIKHEIHGLVTPIKNPQALADNIKTLLNDKNISSNLKKSARERLQTMFVLQKMIDTTQDVYEKRLKT